MAQTDADMPFTKFVTEAEARWAKEHPDAPAAGLSTSEIGKLILDQEAQIAEGHAAGRISDADFQSFRDASQQRLDEFRDEVTQSFHDIADDAKPMVEDMVANWQDYAATHPEAAAAMSHEEHVVVSLSDVADAAQLVIDTGRDVVPGVLGIVDGLVETVGTGLSDAATGVVEARLDADPAAGEAVMAQLETARDGVARDVDQVHHGIEDANDQFSVAADQADEAIQGMRDYAAEHPDAHVETHMIIADPDHTFEADQHVGEG